MLNTQNLYPYSIRSKIEKCCHRISALELLKSFIKTIYLIN